LGHAINAILYGYLTFSNTACSFAKFFIDFAIAVIVQTITDLNSWDAVLAMSR
jgi:hypothetical protein